MSADKFELFGGRLGNGITVCNKAVMEDGDFKHICHISPEGEISWRVPRSYCPADALETIERWAAEEKSKYERWFASIGAEKRYAIRLDRMKPSELVDYITKRREAKKRVEDIKRKQNEYVTRCGGMDGLFEADDTYNDFNRELIAAFAEVGFESFIGKINHYEDRADIYNGVKSVYEPYKGQHIYNSGCDFIIPFDDMQLAAMIREWNTPGKMPNLSIAEQIYTRVERLGGINLLWK